MKKIILSTLLLFAVMASEQIHLADPVTLKGKKSQFYQIFNSQFWVGCSTMFLAGSADATMQVIKSDYPSFKRVIPGAHDSFWDASQSWTNKYKGGNPANGAKFPGSTTIFVSFTDGWHTVQFIRNLFIASSVTVNMIPDAKIYVVDDNGAMHKERAKNINRKWYVIGSKLLINWAAFNIGKETTFQIFRFKH